MLLQVVCASNALYHTYGNRTNKQRGVELAGPYPGELNLADDKLRQCRFCGTWNRCPDQDSSPDCCDPKPIQTCQQTKRWHQARPGQDLALWIKDGGYDREQLSGNLGYYKNTAPDPEISW